MKQVTLALCAALLAFGLGVQDAEAKRLGGGTSRGLQRDTVTQRQAAPNQPAGTPTQQAAPQAAPQPGASAGMPAQPPKRSWLGPLAGLAAGIGLAALFSHLGLGEGMANFFMIALLVMAAIFILKLLFGRKASTPAGAPPDPMSYAGVGGPGMTPVPDTRFDTAAPAAAAAGSSTVMQIQRAIPADFDVEGFARVAKVNFIRLQAAHDAGNLDDIREFTTPEMFAEIQLDIAERKAAPQTTDVVTLDAEVLEVVTEANRHVASVRFHGMIREEKDGAAEAFDEVWNLVKSLEGGRGWAVAGIQQLN